MFKINVMQTIALSESISGIARNLSGLTSELSDCIRAVSGMKGMEEVIGSLNAAKGSLEDETHGADSVGSSLARTSECYDRGENNILVESEGIQAFQTHHLTVTRLPVISAQSEALIKALIP